MLALPAGCWVALKRLTQPTVEISVGAEHG